MDYNKLVQEVYAKITDNKDARIHGQNKNILDYYYIWKGKPSWQTYSVWYNNQEHEAKYMTFNLPRQITRVWANNYANEGISIGLANKQATDRLHEILKNNHFFDNFNNFTEGFFGVGSGAIIVGVDSFDVNEETQEVLFNRDAFVKITFVEGRRVIPITVEDGSEEGQTISSTIDSWIIGTNEDGSHNVTVTLSDGSKLKEDIIAAREAGNGTVEVTLADGSKTQLPQDILDTVHSQTYTVEVTL